MNKLQEEFRKGRRKGTPLYIVNTTDVSSAIAQAMSVKITDDEDEALPPAVMWDCVRGPVTPIESSAGAKISSETASIKAESDDETGFVPTGNHIQDLPQVLVNAGKNLDRLSVLFLVIQDNSILEYAPVAEAIHSLRDKFKRNLRTLVLVGLDVQPPPFLSQDIVVLDDPLPGVAELREIVQKLVDETGSKVKPKDIDSAAGVCLGMTRFSAESGVARELKSTGIDIKSLSLTRQNMIESATNKALTFQRESWTFDDMGGMSNFKTFTSRLFNGRRPPRGVVLIDEMEKSMGGAEGPVADNTGASQYILQSLLTNMENNKWIGIIAAGSPGTGKTLASVCVGNQFGVPSLVLDLGATKAKELGATEANMRRLMKIIFTIFGENCLFMATVNRMDTVPKALRRRYRLGTWYWDTPSAEEGKQIWEVQLKRFGIAEKPNFGYSDWTGSDIRDCCEMAYMLNCSLREAAECISISGVANRADTEKMRTIAEQEQYRSPNYPGAFKKNRTPTKSREIITELGV